MRARKGDMFVLREAAPLFSRSPNCAGVVVAFGAERHRAVLSDIDSFGMPVSAAQHLTLPADPGELDESPCTSVRQARSMRRAADPVQDPCPPASSASSCSALLRQALERGVAGSAGQTRAIGLLQASAPLPSQVLYLPAAVQASGTPPMKKLLACLKDFFLLRRGRLRRRRRRWPSRAGEDPGGRRCASTLAAVPCGPPSPDARRATTRTYTAGLVRSRSGSRARRSSKDEIVAHCNVCVHFEHRAGRRRPEHGSCLILTQLPLLRRELRHEIRAASSASGAVATAFHRRSILDRVMNKVAAAVSAGPLHRSHPDAPDIARGYSACPRTARWSAVYHFWRIGTRQASPIPGTFRPSRSGTASPTPFEYFPSGAGRHMRVSGRRSPCRSSARAGIPSRSLRLRPRYGLTRRSTGASTSCSCRRNDPVVLAPPR